MAGSDNKLVASPGARVNMADDEDRQHDGERNGAPDSASAVVRRGEADSAFSLYKAGQAQYLRWASAIGAGIIAIAGAKWIYDQLALLPAGLAENPYVRSGVPVLIVAAAAWLIFQLIGQRRPTVDFLIATEGEMKKVNWSTRKEVFGATRVVIVTVFSLAILLFLVDLLFIVFFSSIGVLKVDVSKMFKFGATGG